MGAFRAEHRHAGGIDSTESDDEAEVRSFVAGRLAGPLGGTVLLQRRERTSEDARQAAAAAARAEAQAASARAALELAELSVLEEHEKDAPALSRAEEEGRR